MGPQNYILKLESLDPASVVSRLLEFVVVEPEEVRQLMDDSDPDFVLYLLGRVARIFNWPLKDENPVGMQRRVKVSSLCERNSFVKAEECFIFRHFHPVKKLFRRIVFDDDCDVL